jgi:protease PrsW
VTVNVAAALVPVVAFLVLLFLMDSFKLVHVSNVASAVGIGAVSALAAFLLHGWMLPALGVSPLLFSRYVAPVTEETLKASFVAFLLWRGRLGFLVDCAIVGFAVGTGFALVENLEYLRSSSDTRFIFWMVRGFGTAVLHGATTAIFAMLAKALSQRSPQRVLATPAAAWLAAVGIHSLFNHFLLPPLVTTAVLLVSLPVAVSVVYGRSERATREWMGEGLDLDVELLNLITSAEFGGTRLGSYLRELRDRFPGTVVGDMFCLLRVELELSIRAKGMLMARQAGLDVPVDASVKDALVELRYLKQSIGKTGLLALAPLRMVSTRDTWHQFLLEQAGETGPFGRLRTPFRGRHNP